eukprot:628655_1
MGVVCTNDIRMCIAETCDHKPKKTIIHTEVIYDDWADAVTKHCLAGIKGLHCIDADLINAVVDSYGCTAIHYAVHSTNDQILRYLLQHDIDINAQGGPQYNTALHEAVLANNLTAVQHLFCHHMDDQLRNNENQLAIDLCPDRYRRRLFIKAKQCGIKQSKRTRELHRQISTILFRNANLNETDPRTIRRMIDATSEEQTYFNGKKKEIQDRAKPITQFGKECGVDIDEIAMVLVNKTSSRLWVQLTKQTATNHVVTKQTRVYKILFGLTKYALKERYGRSRVPHDACMRQLTSLLCEQIRKRNTRNRLVLTKDVFVRSFHYLLFIEHDKMIAKEF